MSSRYEAVEALEHDAGEKLWRWLRTGVWCAHRLASDRHALPARVTAFLDQFVSGSEALLHYVGLLGDHAARRAQARRAA